MKNYVAEILFDNHEKWKEHKYIFEKENGAFRPHTYGEFYEDALSASFFGKSRDYTERRLGFTVRIAMILW